MASHQPQQYRSARPAGHRGRVDPSFDEQGGTRLAGSIGFGLRHPHHHHHHQIHLVLYPFQSTRSFVVSRKGVRFELAKFKEVTALGRIYVMGGRGESYEAAGGPPPGKGHKDSGGHRAGYTPPGLYILGRQEHHTTMGWPNSSIPYGAPLRAGSDGYVEFLDHGHWKKADGPHGVWTEATKQFSQRDGEPAVITEEDKSDFRKYAYRQDGSLRPTWIRNDFGEWSWNLMRLGKRTPYYVHTTPEDEAFYRAPVDRDVILALVGQSHGCVHLLPRDRDEMMQRGYLKQGIHIQIMHYKQKGPPKDWVPASSLEHA
ncbi:MAG: hypothetical protein WA765_06215 [Candidatus Acidiferrum sp.]